MLNIGTHLSISKGFLSAAKVATQIDANTFQYFSRNPRGGAVKPLDLKDLEDFKVYSRLHNFTQLLCHAPYTLNSCSSNPDTREFAKRVFTEDLKVMELFDNGLYNFHPGSHTGQGEEVGIKQTAKILNEVLNLDMKTTVLIETMSGKGTEIGKTFAEIKQIIDLVELKDKIGVCLDTCHVYSAGYDIVNNLEGVLNEFDKVIGLDKLKAIHLNDSLTLFNSHKDRHAEIGKGSIGLEAIVRIINHPYLCHLPFFLETPLEEKEHKKEIDLLRNEYQY